jgi:hypothetical protein
MNKWKSKQTGRIVEVLGDEVQNGKKYRFFVFEDHPDTLCQWDLIYAAPWEENFEPLDNSVKA